MLFVYFKIFRVASEREALMRQSVGTCRLSNRLNKAQQKNLRNNLRFVDNHAWSFIFVCFCFQTLFLQNCQCTSLPDKSSSKSQLRSCQLFSETYGICKVSRNRRSSFEMFAFSRLENSLKPSQERFDSTDCDDSPPNGDSLEAGTTCNVMSFLRLINIELSCDESRALLSQGLPGSNFFS